MALYSMYYMTNNMKIGELASDATFLVYVYLFIACYCCAAGAISMKASYWFIKKLYNA